jgi:hypothetical protein
VRLLLSALLPVLLLVDVPASAAKDFRPGDVRLCNATRCLAVQDRPALRMLGAFYYGPDSPPLARQPRLGAPMFELRFTNGYVTGIVSSVELDRFLSYGVNLGHFRRGSWYRFPQQVSLELRRLARPLTPLHLTRAALYKSA